MANTWLHVAGDAIGVAFCHGTTNWHWPPSGLMTNNFTSPCAVRVRHRIVSLGLSDNGFARVTANTIAANSLFQFVDDGTAILCMTFCACSTGTQFCSCSSAILNDSFLYWLVNPGTDDHGSTITATATSYTLTDTCSGCKSLLVSHGTDWVQGGNSTVIDYSTLAGGLGVASGSRPELDVEYVIRHASTFNNLRIYISSNSQDTGTDDFWLRDDSSPARACLACWPAIPNICACTTGEFVNNPASACVASGSTLNYVLATDPSGMAGDSMTITTVSIYQDGVGHNVMASDAAGDQLASGTVFATLEGDINQSTGTNADISQPIEWVATNMFVRTITAHGSSKAVGLRDDCTDALSITICACTTGTDECTGSCCLLACSTLRWRMTGCGQPTVTYVGFELQPPACTPLTHPGWWQSVGGWWGD